MNTLPLAAEDADVLAQQSTYEQLWQQTVVELSDISVLSDLHIYIVSQLTLLCLVRDGLMKCSGGRLTMVKVK